MNQNIFEKATANVKRRQETEALIGLFEHFMDNGKYSIELVGPFCATVFHIPDDLREQILNVCAVYKEDLEREFDKL